MNKETITRFITRHPVLYHLVLAMIVFFAGIYAIFLSLDIFTFHGQETTVPDVRYKPAKVAIEMIKAAGLNYEIDSIYNEDYSPGIIIEQDPAPNATVKSNRDIFLTMNMISTPKVVFPNDLSDMPGSDGVTLLKSLGFKNVVCDTVPSDKMDLIIGIKVNGRNIGLGSKVAINAKVRLTVGDGSLDAEEYDPLGESRDKLIQEKIKSGEITVTRDSITGNTIIN